MTTDIDTMPTARHLPCLNFFEQIDVISKARICLSLRAPDDDAVLEEKNVLNEEQRRKILSFDDLLHDTPLGEHGKVLLCLYQCESYPDKTGPSIIFNKNCVIRSLESTSLGFANAVPPSLDLLM
jgi:hypothetical protein